MEITWQIAGAKKPLASVGRMCDAGNVVVFTKQGGFICGDHGRLAFTRKNDTYVRTTWVRKTNRQRQTQAMDVDSGTGFARPGHP